MQFPLNTVTQRRNKIGSFFFLCLLSFTSLNVLDCVGNTLLASWTSLMIVFGHSMHLLANLSLHPRPPFHFFDSLLFLILKEECFSVADAKLSSLLEIILVNLSLYRRLLFAFLFPILLEECFLRQNCWKSCPCQGQRHLFTDFCEPVSQAGRLQPCYLLQFVSS